MNYIKEIEKFNSFDKRIEAFARVPVDADGETAAECIRLVVAKAKYGQHFAEIVSLAGRLQFDDKATTLVRLSRRANEHPDQGGTCAWVLSRLGLHEQAQSVWDEIVEREKSKHPNLHARALAFGLAIPSLADKAQRLIGEAKASARYEDVPEWLFDAPDMSKFVCLTHWFSF